nr:GNAT family N-acetyltransferase [uncultured Cohaesibacter sp.]
MSYSIRVAMPSELAELGLLSKLSFSAGLVGAYSSAVIEGALPFISHVSEPLVRSGQLYVAEGKDGALVGAGGWSCDYHGIAEVAGVAHIRQFVVHPDYMKQGVGRALFARCLEEAHDIGQFDCQASLSAISFYRSLGFEEISDDMVTLPNGVEFPTRLMRYRRTSPVAK